MSEPAHIFEDRMYLRCCCSTTGSYDFPWAVDLKRVQP
jgi:hypothetical protein